MNEVPVLGVEPRMNKARLALLDGINEELATHSRNEQAVFDDYLDIR